MAMNSKNHAVTSLFNKLFKKKQNIIGLKIVSMVETIKINGQILYMYTCL